MIENKRLYERLETCTDNHLRLDILFDIATNFLNFDEKRVLEVAEEIKAFSEQIDNNLGRSYYHSTRGRVLFKKSLYADCEIEFTKALEYALLTPDLLHQAMCHDSLGILYSYQYNFEAALQQCFKALETYEKTPGITSKKYKGVCYNNIGSAYERIHDYENAYRYFLIGLEHEEKQDDERIKFNLINNLGNVAIQQGNYTEGMRYAQLAKEGFEKLNHKNGQIAAGVHIAHCNLGLGNFAQATTQYLAALKLLKSVDHKPMEIEALLGLGKVYVKLGAHDEGLKHFEKALALAVAIGDDRELAEVYHNIGLTYMALQMPTEAIAAWDAGIELCQKRNMLPFLKVLQEQREMVAS